MVPFMKVKFITVCLVAFNSPVTGREQPEPSPLLIPATTSDAQITVDHLQVVLRPLTKDELKVELGGWLELLQAKIREVGDIELKLKALAEGDSQEAPLKEQLLTLRSEESDVTERAQTVLDALKAKGGDVQEQQDYINAVTDIGEATDATSRWAAIVAEVKMIACVRG